MISRGRRNASARLGGVHLIDSDNKLSHTKGEGEEGMLASLAVLGDTCLELTSTASNDENGTISLGSSCDHVFDEVAVSGGVNDLSIKTRSVTRRGRQEEGNAR